MSEFPTKKLVYMALLTSLSIVFSRIFSIRIPFYGVEAIRIGIGGLPIILAGLLFGPLAGGIVGAFADLLGFWINPIGAYMPHFTFSAFLTGFIPAAIYYYLFKGKNSYFRLLIAIAVGQITTTVILVPYFIHILFGAPLVPLMIPRLVGEPISIIFYAYIANYILEYEPFNLPKKVSSLSD